MASKSIHLVTFNHREAAAVDQFLDDLTQPPTVWMRRGSQSLVAGRFKLKHVTMSAQGNVVASAYLAAEYAKPSPPDFLVFYGCAGAADSKDVGSAFLVEAAMYLSLGTVSPHVSLSEEVTLKNKWLSEHDPRDVTPLRTIGFPLSASSGSIDLAHITDIPKAHVAATDKVVKVGLGTVPQPLQSKFGVPVYTKGEWSYRDALAFAKDRATPAPLLVDMESYGIGLLADELGLLDRVAILRIATDALADHSASDSAQSMMLLQGLQALAVLVLALFQPSHPALSPGWIP